MTNTEFLVEDFKLKLSYLEGQFSRLWQRLGFFLTLETAVFGFYGWLKYQSERGATDIHKSCALGLGITIIWYVIAAQDRLLVDQYRERVERAAERVGNALDLANVGLPNYEAAHPGVAVDSQVKGPFSWYWRLTSITKMPVWISLLLTGVWIGLLLSGVRIVL